MVMKKAVQLLLVTAMVFTSNGMTVLAGETEPEAYVAETEAESTEAVIIPETETEEIISTETETEGAGNTESNTENSTETVESTEEETEVTESTEKAAEEEAEAAEENTETKNEDAEKPEFSGLSETYQLSKAERADKEELAGYLDKIEEFTEGMDYAEDRVVYLADTEEEADEVADAFDGALLSFSQGVAVIELPEDKTVVDAVTAAADEKMNLPAVWPDYVITASEAETTTEVSEVNTAAYSDPYLSETSGNYQWQHSFVGDSYAWNAGYKGQGITVAVLDSGLLTSHEDLSANAVTGKDYIGTYNEDGEMTKPGQGTAYTADPNGHGTHVAGIIAAQENNSLGGAGIAPDAKVRGYRVLDSSGSGYTSDAMVALRAAIADKVDLVNMSLGGVGYSDLYQTVIDEAYEAGTAIFAAAGNEGTNGVSYPAAYDHVYSVAALQPSGGIAYFSNYGSTVDFAFPGVNIYSTYNESTSAYISMDGTSQATPVAVGTAAVILSANLDSISEKTGGAKVDALGSVMKKAATKSSSGGTGSGYTYLPKALNLSTVTGTPKAPTFTQKKGTYDTESVTTTILAESGTTIYYATNGKTPSYKDGVAKNYTGTCASGKSLTLTGSRTVKISAIAVNSAGKASKAASVTYTLKPIPTGVNIYPYVGGSLSKSATPQNILPGGSLTFKAVVTPSYACSTKVEWSVAPAGQGVTVSSSGKVKAAKTAIAGAYSVTATTVGSDGKTYNGHLSTFTVNVLEKADVKSVSLGLKKATLTLGSTSSQIELMKYLKAVMVDGNELTYSESPSGNPANTYVSYISSNTSVATVTAAGRVTAQAPGTAVITALANDGSGKKATCKVTVKSKPTDITISPVSGASGNLAAGKSLKLTASLTPANANVEKAVVWSVTSSPEGATGVTVKNGTVKAAKNATTGTYTITAALKSDATVCGNYSVTVYSAAVESIKFAEKSYTLFTTAGNSGAITSVQLNPAITAGDGASKGVVYTSSKPGVAKVDSSGKVTAKSEGTTTITCAATDGSKKKATCTIKVQIPMSKLTISPKGGMTEYIGIKKSVTYGATCNTEYGKPSSTKLVWTSSDEKVAKVSNGKVTGVSEGTAVITATAADGSGVAASYSVNIIKAATYVRVRKNYYYNVYEIVTDSDCPYYQITVPNKNVRIQSTGYLYEFKPVFFKEGRYTIKVKCLDGSNKSGTIRVNVK